MVIVADWGVKFPNKINELRLLRDRYHLKWVDFWLSMENMKK